MTIVEVQLIEGLGLPYTSGAEGALLDSGLDPVFNDAWQAFVIAFPGKTLMPLFGELPVERLADMVDAIRLNGDEPPDPFVWFTLSSEEFEIDAVLAAVRALPMVVFAEERIAPVVAGNISYGTNPETPQTLQIKPAPNGIDAIYAWDVVAGAGDGIHVVDIENGWRLDHDELKTARVNSISVFGARDVDHGTAVAGIVVGADNGVGTIGIVPNADLDLVTVDRGFGVFDLAAAIDAAAADLVRGDVLLIPLGQPFALENNADVLVEFNRPVQNAIARATLRGITVIEAAGNGDIDLDTTPAAAHTRPESPTFSGAIVVGAGQFTGPALDKWKRAKFGTLGTTFGSRVDCFADGQTVRAPSSAATDAYQFFSGTSSASAVIAGAAASLQAMIRAATGGVLAPADVRRLFRSALLGTLTDNPLERIGPLPDLREITRAQGLVRVLPVAAAAIGGDALLLVHLDADNRVVRRHFTLLTGWGQPLSSPTIDGSPSPSDQFEVGAAQPVVTSSDETDPIDRLIFDAFFSGPGGIHHMFWDSLDQSGDVSVPIAPLTAAAQGRALAAVRPLINLVVLAGISPEGRLITIVGDPQILSSSTLPPVTVDVVGMYRRLSGPTMISRGTGLVDIVAIEDRGTLNWFTGAVAAAGLTGPLSAASVVFAPGARPALLASGGGLLAAAVSTDGLLQAITLDPVKQTIEPPVIVDVGVPVATFGPVALGLTALNVVALAVDTQGTLRAATRLIGGGTWTPLAPLLSLASISPLGGVTAVTTDIGVMAIVVGVDGVVCSAISVDGVIWSPLVPLP